MVTMRLRVVHGHHTTDVVVIAIIMTVDGAMRKVFVIVASYRSFQSKSRIPHVATKYRHLPYLAKYRHLPYLALYHRYFDL